MKKEETLDDLIHEFCGRKKPSRLKLWLIKRIDKLFA